ncbi:MAG: hypothetical protein DIZ77_09220 [endosymbiont of Seepiophila jonesi]|uniref:DUF5666 domain-containing protein n=1 Tax=endosymbiont of Lamellibrachia luymesi TaxID=2200907 RepID=A0A370DAA7_9GAMM|nr:MAG: hypothetical protein DIZ79_18110 [endosymbiont of Lamellibrachia luymesi]RDH92097.1 MAG: hypothetical protein DIZ77_09220 [endosymbiont of Seepiophila jonesi]
MKTFPILLTTLILSGCGGGGETQTADGGIGGTGVAWGRVTGFGSIYLNDIKYETTTTSYQFEEPDRVDQSDLKVGMVVRITGSNDGVNGEAETVEYADLLEGTVSGNDIAGSNSLTVMGQTVIVDLDTIYDNGGTAILLVDNLPIDAVIEVSGFSDGLGVIYATRIEVKSATWNGTDQLEVKGIVQNLTATTFELGGLTVDWSAAGLPDGNPVEGQYVEAKGDSFNGATFEANEVETEGDGDLEWAEDGEELEIEGIVTTDFDDVTNQFTLNGQTVQITASTEFEDGDSGDILAGKPLEVEGTMDGTLLIASEIEFGTDSADKLEIEDTVASVDLGAGSFTTVLSGQTFVTTTSTIFIDELTNDQFFSLASLNLGDSVDVNYVDDVGVLTATKVERE